MGDLSSVIGQDYRKLEFIVSSVILLQRCKKRRVLRLKVVSYVQLCHKLFKSRDYAEFLLCAESSLSYGLLAELPKDLLDTLTIDEAAKWGFGVMLGKQGLCIP